jgi:hypothetical protein
MQFEHLLDFVVGRNVGLSKNTVIDIIRREAPVL